MYLIVCLLNVLRFACLHCIYYSYAAYTQKLLSILVTLRHAQTAVGPTMGRKSNGRRKGKESNHRPSPSCGLDATTLRHCLCLSRSLSLSLPMCLPLPMSLCQSLCPGQVSSWRASFSLRPTTRQQLTFATPRLVLELAGELSGDLVLGPGAVSNRCCRL